MNKSFDDFILARCAEIIDNDEICGNLNNKIINSECKIKEFLTKEQYGFLIEYMNAVLAFNTRCEKLVYKAGFNDRLAAL